MAKFCTDCGHRLRDPDGPCPVCESGGTPRVPESGPSPDDDRRRTTRVSQGRRIRRIVIAVLAVIIILAALAIGACAALSHFRVIDLPLANPPENLQELNDQRISVTNEGDGRSDDGWVTFTVTLPDYTELYQQAVSSDDPDAYVRNALERGTYSIKRIEKRVDAANKDIAELKQQVADEVLEDELIAAVNALVEDSDD